MFWKRKQLEWVLAAIDLTGFEPARRLLWIDLFAKFYILWETSTC